MHGMHGHGGCGGCNCNCEPLTREQEKERLGNFREMLEKKLERVKEREAELSKEK